MVRIWHLSWRGEHALSSILPIVVYHGPKAWQISPNFRDLFNVPNVFLDFYFPDFRYDLIDLSSLSEAELKGRVALRVALRAMKYIFSDELPERLPQIFALLRELAHQKRAVGYGQTVLRYLSAGSDKITRENVKQALEESFPEEDALMSTIAQQWIEEGEKKGIRKACSKASVKGC